MFSKSSRATLINAVMKYLNFRSSASKLESITCKFTKSRTPSEVVFEEFHYKCRTAILKNASRWLLLGTTLFSKYSSMAASQRQLQRYIYFRNSRLRRAYTIKFFFHGLEIFILKEKCRNISGSEICVVKLMRS